MVLDRNEDMINTGGRHPYLSKYKALILSVVNYSLHADYRSALQMMVDY